MTKGKELLLSAKYNLSCLNSFCNAGCGFFLVGQAPFFGSSYISSDAAVMECI